MISADILGERARLTPDAEALVEAETGRRWTYAQLDERAIRCALLWREVLGLDAGDRVGVLAHNRREILEAFFAASKSGHVLVPLGTRLAAAELESILRDCGLRALLYDGELAHLVEALRSTFPDVQWVALDEPTDPSDRLYSLTDELDPHDFRPTRCQPEDLYCLLYTSGTTGRPKGVMVPHRMVAWNGFNTVCGWQLRADDVSPIFTPLYHAGGLMAFLVPIFVIGGTIVLHRELEPGAVWRTIQSEGCTVVLGVPTIWKMLLDDPGFETADLSQVRWFISGGAPLPEYLIEAYQAKGVPFKQGFGMTEVGVNCFAMTVRDSETHKGSIGKPMMFTEVRLADAAGNDVEVGQVGELLFRGPHVSLGYWNNPDATTDAHDPDGWFHSGDLARCDESGYYYIAGRQKDMIISGGVNVYPAEIEAALLLHPGVEDAAVVGVPHPRWGETGIAFVVAREGIDLAAEALARHLETRLARYKVPKAFRFVAALPRTPYGKVVKGELRERFLAEGRQ